MSQIYIYIYIYIYTPELKLSVTKIMLKVAYFQKVNNVAL